MMLKPYPDSPWPAFLRVLADTVVFFWTVVWAYLGWLIYQTVMGLQAIADGMTNTGATFNKWIAAFRQVIPNDVPLLTKFLQDMANALQHYSGDQLVSAGHNIHDAIIRVAITLALLVALPPILLVLLPYGGWRSPDTREAGAPVAVGWGASSTRRADAAGLFARRGGGSPNPSTRHEAAFEVAIDEISVASHRLLEAVAGNLAGAGHRS